MADVEVSWWGEPPDDGTIRALAGSIVASLIPSNLGSPDGDLIRCARVLSVDDLARAGSIPPPCARCGEVARFRLLVEWEAGFTSPDGNLLCERCTCGPVTAGREWFVFGGGEPRTEAVHFSIVADLRRFRGEP